ncbi:MAG: hypothetical protein ACXW4B_11090 [Micavibrio sp.]
MGSLASHPKPPAQPQYVPVYYTAPIPPASPDPVPTGQTPDSEPTPVRRNANLLDRSRGVLSTVLTGFRGVLSQTSTPPRKTLLGE